MKKDKIRKILMHPCTILTFYCFLGALTFSLLMVFVSQNPNASDSVDFVNGARFGVVLAIFLDSLLNIPFCFFALGRYVQKHKNGGDSNG